MILLKTGFIPFATGQARTQSSSKPFSAFSFFQKLQFSSQVDLSHASQQHPQLLSLLPLPFPSPSPQRRSPDSSLASRLPPPPSSSMSTHSTSTQSPFPPRPHSPCHCQCPQDTYL